MENRREELERFKTDINLCEYACSMYSFVVDKALSGRSSVVLRHANGDKLIVTRKPNRNYVYFNAKGDDSGTILDFIQARKTVSLGKIRQELRAWRAVDMNIQATNNPIVLRPSKHDASKVLRSWEKATDVVANNRYLLGERQIPSSTFVTPVFIGQIRTDNRANVLFAHRNLEGELTGFEIKNRSFAGFSPGGMKSLFSSAPDSKASTAVLCESGVDLLSFAALFGMQGKRLFSTAGQVSASQLEGIVAALRSMPALKTVWLAFDNDQAGIALSTRMQNELELALPGIKSIVELPTEPGADWNDQLRFKTANNSPKL